MKEDDGQENDIEMGDDNDMDTQEPLPIPVESKVIDDDGIFTVTIGSTQISTIDTKENIYKDMFVPPSRMNSGLVVKHNILYLYGGLFEDENRQYTLNDFYSLGNNLYIRN